jgi:uncharacterized protein YdeI (YjbR/CyaY-like superfamily)
MESFEFPNRAAWEAWLEEHHATAGEAWLRIGKRNSGAALLSIEEAGDGALCFGWIDGLRRSLDEVSFLQRYCRRQPRSPWSQRNATRAQALADAGRMRPSGLAEIAAAQADGRWERAYEPQSTAKVPADLQAALAAQPQAAAVFNRLGRSDQYSMILPLLKAADPEARAAAVARAIARLSAND